MTGTAGQDLDRVPAGGIESGVSRFVEGTRRIAGLTLISRILGLVRDQLQYSALGTGWQNAMFVSAWMVPNLFRSLFGEGALSAAFVPSFTRTLDREGTRSARMMLASVAGALIWILAAAAALVVVGAAFLPPAWLGLPERHGADGVSQGRLLLDLLGILFPYLIPICLVALAAGALNSTGRFAVPSLAPALLNVVWIGALVYVLWSDGTPLQDRVRTMAWFLVGGGIAQLALQLPSLHRARLMTWPDFALTHPGLREVARTMGPMVLGLSVVQLNVVVDQVVALYLVPRDGANTLIYLGNRLLLFPQALVGTAMATAVFPLLSLLGGRREEARLRGVLEQALSLAEFLAIPAAAGLFAIAWPLLNVLFVHGRFTVRDAEDTLWVVRALAIGLPFMTANQILVRAHYALGDTTGPLRIALKLLLLNLVLNVLLARPLGAAGLSLSTSLCAALNTLALFRSLPLAKGQGWNAVFSAVARTLAIAAVMAGLVWAMTHLLEPLAGAGRAARGLLLVALPCAAGLAIFLAVSRLVRAPELGQLLERKVTPPGETPGSSRHPGRS